MSSAADASKEAVLHRIAGTEAFHPSGHDKFRIREQSVHVRYCRTNPKAPLRYRFNINPNTLTADHGVWICGDEGCYYLVPASALRMMYDDPAAYQDSHHPNIRIVAVDTVAHSAAYARGGRKYDLHDHHLAILYRPQPSALFVVGQSYSRRDVQDVLAVPEERRGGDWDTGYTSYEGSVYVFCNVGIAGRTGHDYPNRWVADTLQWSAKTGAHLQQPSTRELINGDIPVHVFWRDEDRKPFYYAGAGRATDVRDESPVRLTWQFDNRAEWHPERSPEEELEADTYPEGAVRRVTVNSYERNPQARARCIEHYGATCQVCGFDFKSTYGDIGANFIHVHHLLDLAEVGGEYTVDPIKDLRPVCPNCHAMLHRKRPAYTLPELSVRIRKSPTSGA